MSERNISRRMATSLVDALKAQGHILVVKGGTTPLVRELDERMAARLDTIVSRIVPRAAVGGEVTSTFGDDAVDEAVERLVESLTRTLMDSDHVEDVFAEDNVIQRDIFRVVRDTLLRREELDADDEDELPIRVRLDTLGYVASTVGKLADAVTIRETLERAASAVEGQLASYSPQTREATFLLEGGGPDRRLELEEAVADELSDLVDTGIVDLPTIDRQFQIGRETTTRERAQARPRVEVAAAKTIMRSGCAAAWEFTDPRTVKVTFTPLSEQDAGDIDHYMPQFAREVSAIFGRSIEIEPVEPLEPPRPNPAAAPPAPRSSHPTTAASGRAKESKPRASSRSTAARKEATRSTPSSETATTRAAATSKRVKSTSRTATKKAKASDAGSSAAKARPAASAAKSSKTLAKKR